jgi:hypothetical protein
MIGYASVCPFCFYRATAADAVGPAGAGRPRRQVPQAGDVSFCIGCGEFSIFAEGGGLRRPTEAEAAASALDPDIVAAKQAWRETVAKFGRPMGGYSDRKGSA